jgi:molecular chaperone GrpE
LLEAIRRMAHLAEYRKPNILSHLERMRGYSEVIASGLGLDPAEAQIIACASMLHDIGEVELPDSVSNRNGQLTPYEWELIKRHPVIGADLLRGSSSPVLQMGEVIALSHHERWDGSGYPRGLKEEEIPLGGRICALADVFDALIVEESNMENIESASMPKDAEAAPETTCNKEGVPVEENDQLKLQKLLDDQTQRAQEHYDRLLRLQADFENFRRRTRQEKDDFYKYASEQLVTALLPVLDNFALALATEGDSVEGFKEGVRMIHRQLLDVLAAEGVTPIQAVGEPFDPTRHEAVAQDDSGEHPANTVVGEFRRGYCLRDKVIRPAMVRLL